MAKKAQTRKSLADSKKAAAAACRTAPATTDKHYALLERLIGTAHMSAFKAALSVEFFEDDDDDGEDSIPDKDDVVAVFAEYLERHMQLFDRMTKALVEAHEVFIGEEVLTEALQQEVLELSANFEGSVVKAQLDELYAEVGELYKLQNSLKAVQSRFGDVGESRKLAIEIKAANASIAKLEQRYPDLKRPVADGVEED